MFLVCKATTNKGKTTCADKKVCVQLRTRMKASPPILLSIKTWRGGTVMSTVLIVEVGNRTIGVSLPNGRRYDEYISCYFTS